VLSGEAFLKMAGSRDATRNEWCPPGVTSQPGLDFAGQNDGVREGASGLFRVDGIAVDADLEDTAFGGNEPKGADAELEFEEFGRQTDGPGLVVSGGAVFDCDFGTGHGGRVLWSVQRSY
jgi:hypothetical protein